MSVRCTMRLSNNITNSVGHEYIMDRITKYRWLANLYLIPLWTLNICLKCWHLVKWTSKVSYFSRKTFEIIEILGCFDLFGIYTSINIVWEFHQPNYLKHSKKMQFCTKHLVFNFGKPPWCSELKVPGAKHGSLPSRRFWQFLRKQPGAAIEIPKN